MEVALRIEENKIIRQEQIKKIKKCTIKKTKVKIRRHTRKH